MTQVQVQDASMGIGDGGATIVKLSVVMVRGRFHDAVSKEIDAENIHPAIRDHLARWAGGNRLELLESFVNDVETMVNDGSHSYEKLAELLREVGR